MELLFNPLKHPILLTQPRRLTPFSAWHKHIPAALLLADLLEPSVFVELGTHYGDSYCAFCQAVQELQLGTHCYAVDTWQGDTQTGFYGPEVLADLRAHHDPLYGTFSTLVQSTFDEALNHFKDRTVDLLHIDGYHTYEAVKHDFECWFGKLSDRAVILLHDINVRERDFGVWRLWEEVSPRFPHFDFSHGHGLGILAVGSEQPAEFEALLAMSEEERIRTRNLMFQLGSRLELDTRIAVPEKKQIIDNLEAKMREKEEIEQDLSAQVAQQEQALQVLKQRLEEKERTIQSLQQTVKEQTEHLDALVARIEFLTARESELRAMFLDAHTQIAERDNEIQRLRRESNSPLREVETASTYIQYQQLIGRIQEAVKDTLPPAAKVIVVSKGDDGLLNLHGREGWHFPQNPDGVYAGYYPADSAAAIAHLEALRASGGEYLLFPRTAFWWFDHYAGFKLHLEQHYQEMADNNDVCRIFSLRKDIARRPPVTTVRVKTKKRMKTAKL